MAPSRSSGSTQTLHRHPNKVFSSSLQRDPVQALVPTLDKRRSDSVVCLWSFHLPPGLFSPSLCFRSGRPPRINTAGHSRSFLRCFLTPSEQRAFVYLFIVVSLFQRSFMQRFPSCARPPHQQSGFTRDPALAAVAIFPSHAAISLMQISHRLTPQCDARLRRVSFCRECSRSHVCVCE